MTVPAQSPSVHGAPLRLQRVWGTTGPVAESGHIKDWQLSGLSDLGTAHGARLRERWGRMPGFTCHRDLVDAVTRGREHEEWDAVAVAYVVPDITFFESVGCYLSTSLDGTPLAFGVDEAGGATTIMALRLLQAAPARTDRGRRLLILLDQPEVLFEMGVRTPDGPAAVAMELGPDPAGAAVRVRVDTGVSQAAAGTRLAALQRRAGSGTAGTPVVLGAGAREAVGATRGVRAPARAGEPPPHCAATWLPVIRNWATWSAAGATVLVVEHDARRRLLARCQLDFACGARATTAQERGPDAPP